MQSQTPQTPQTTFRAQLARAWNTVWRRPLPKLSALLLAFLFWAVIIASDPSLLRERTFSSAVVSVQGIELLRNRGYIVMEDLTSEPIVVRMRVEVKQADYDRVTAASFAPQLNLAQQITGAGTQQVRFTPTYENIGTVVSFEPEFIEVTVEPYATRRVPVVIEKAGENAELIWTSQPVSDPSTLTVTGPKSLVDQVRRVVATLPMNSLTVDRPEDSLTATIELQDAAGLPVTSPLLRVTNESIDTDSVRIDVLVYPMKEIPVSVDSAVTGIPAHGYRLGEVRIMPDTVFVAGAPEALSTMDALYVNAPVDVNGQDRSQAVILTLGNTPGLTYNSVDTVLVEVDIVPAIHVHTYNGLSVTVMGVEPDLVAKLSRPSMSAVISGEYQQVESLTWESVHLYVDAAGLSAGTHTLEVLCRVDGTEEYVFEPELPRVTLTLSQAP